MTTNPSTQEAQAMARIRSHINRSAGQHLRAVRSAASEGTESARRINDPQRASLTPEPLLLATERLHRVDASQLQTPVRIVNGPVEQRQCRPGMCEGLPTCGDHACQGHPGNEVRPEERDGPPERVPGKAASLLGWVVALLVFCVLALAVAVFGPPHDH